MAYLEEPQVMYRQHIDNNVGSKRKSDEIDDFEKIRNLFIDVKKDHFKTFMKNSEVFNDEKIEKLNKVSYEYFSNLKNIKKGNWKNYKLFWQLYKYEEFSYSFQNFLILNMPSIAKILFHIKKGLKNR